jgi:alkanesulfonate monooxygenase SsuD/methylene tetrahydromethanopterin reductase-like flavin-dependent oxidoreductase (luciferase family)
MFARGGAACQHLAMKIGLMVPFSEGEQGAGSWSELKALVQTADEVGLDSVYAADHLLFRDPKEAEPTTVGIHESFTMLSAFAAVTSRVEIGPLVAALPWRNPALLAKMAAGIDEISGGRFVLGLGCGWHEPEFTAFGYEFEHRVSQFADGLLIVAGLLREGRADYTSRWFSAHDAVLRPPGPRPGGIPILIAAKRPRMYALAARYADRWNAAWFGHWEDAHELRTRLTNLAAALDEAGRDPASISRTAGLDVAFPALTTEPTEAGGIVGTAEEVGEALRAYAEAGIDEVICHCEPGTPDAVAQLGRAAELPRAGG